jgi:hypothetical protein
MSEVDDFAGYMLGTTQNRSFDEVLDALRRVGIEDLVRPDLMHRHVLGFIQLRLATRQSKELRVHYWPPDVRFSEEPHTHLWDLVSYVLSGEIASTEYAVDRAPDQALRQQLYLVKPAPGGTVREGTGQHVSASIARTESHGAGSVYVVNHGTYHTSEPVSRMALTLITTSAPKSEFPSVVTTPQSGRAGHAPMVPTSESEQDEFRDALRQALR